MADITSDTAALTGLVTRLLTHTPVCFSSHGLGHIMEWGKFHATLPVTALNQVAVQPQ